MPAQSRKARSRSSPAVAERVEPLPELERDLLVHVEPLLVGCLAEEEVVHGVDPAKLIDRREVIVDAQIGNRVRHADVAAVLADDEERGRLLPPAVASPLPALP